MLSGDRLRSEGRACLWIHERGGGQARGGDGARGGCRARNGDLMCRGGRAMLGVGHAAGFI